MKTIPTAMLIIALSFSVVSFAQTSGMGGMKTEGKATSNCMDMKDMKGMDMQSMDSTKCTNMMKGAPAKNSSKGSASYDTNAIVMKVDTEQGKVTLAHGPVKGLGWPAMTMAFAVRDKALLDKLAVGSKVNVEFKKEGDDYVVTSVK